MTDPNALTDEDVAILEAEETGGELPEGAGEPPVEEPAAEETPPVETPPAEKPPVEEPPAETPPAKEPPVEEPEDFDVKEGDSLEQINAKLNKALRYERNQGKTFKGTIEEQNTRLDAIDVLKAEVIALKEARKTPPVEEDPIPSEEEDPIGHAQGTMKKQGEELATTNERLDNMEIYNQQMNFAAKVTGLEETFRETTPDYDNAREFLIENRTKSLEAYGITDPKAVQADIINNLKQVCITAYKNGKNPAEVVYKMAGLQGYKKAAAPADDKTSQAAKDLEDIARGQDIASKNLNKGGETDTTRSLESLMDLEGEEFDKEWAKKFGSNA